MKNITKNKSYGQVARETELSLSFISRVMRGKRTPSFGSLLKMAKALGMTVDKLSIKLREEKRRNDKAKRIEEAKGKGE